MILFPQQWTKLKMRLSWSDGNSSSREWDVDRNSWTGCSFPWHLPCLPAWDMARVLVMKQPPGVCEEDMEQVAVVQFLEGYPRSALHRGLLTSGLSLPTMHMDPCISRAQIFSIVERNAGGMRNVAHSTCDSRTKLEGKRRVFSYNTSLVFYE